MATWSPRFVRFAARFVLANAVRTVASLLATNYGRDGRSARSLDSHLASEGAVLAVICRRRTTGSSSVACGQQLCRRRPVHSHHHRNFGRNRRKSRLAVRRACDDLS